MSAQVLLERLQNVRKNGDGWRCDCPNGHSKAKGSLAVTESSDGVTLAHCFACGDVQGILSAVGLTVSDLFPKRIRDPSPEGRQRTREAFQRNGWRAALGVLSREATVVLCAAGMLRQGTALSREDDARLSLAMHRIDSAREVLSAR